MNGQKILIDVKEIMKNEFSYNSYYFMNEQQFQFELAQTLAKKLKNTEKVFLEVLTLIENGKKKKRCYSDIVIRDEEGQFFVIELKYKTKNDTCNIHNFGIDELSEQGAANLSRYDYLNDVKRIEILQEQYNNKNQSSKKNTLNKLLGKYVGGCAILLTNDKSYSEKNKTEATKRKLSYMDFCIADKDEIKKDVKLKFRSNKKAFSSRKPLKFSNDYYFSWYDYGTVNQKIGQKYQFKYLITERI